MLGFIDVELRSGLGINGLRLLSGKNGLWVAMPSIRRVDKDGSPICGVDGKSLYNYVVEFRDRATTERFRRLIVELVRAAHPNDLAGT